MEAGFLISVAMSPLGLLAGLALFLAGLVGYRALRARWNTAGIARSTRATETLVLVATTVAAWLVVVVGAATLQAQAAREQMRQELAQRSAQSQALRAQIEAQIDAARSLLADRAVEHVVGQRLAQARAELARFAALRDPRILQMIALIDRELALRASEQRGPERSDSP